MQLFGKVNNINIWQIIHFDGFEHFMMYEQLGISYQYNTRVV